MINYNLPRGPVALAAGLFLLLLSACQTEKSALETSSIFWSAIAKNDIVSIKKYCTTESQYLLISPQLSSRFDNATFEYGKILIDGNQATIESFVTSPLNKTRTFNTYLVKESKRWKVDYRRSTVQFLGNKIIENVFKSLNSLGETFNRQLEKQLPLIEKEFESFGQELKKGLDDFNDELDKSFPQKEPHTDPYKNSI